MKIPEGKKNTLYFMKKSNKILQHVDFFLRRTTSKNKVEKEFVHKRTFQTYHNRLQENFQVKSLEETIAGEIITMR